MILAKISTLVYCSQHSISKKKLKSTKKKFEKFKFPPNCPVYIKLFKESIFQKYYHATFVRYCKHTYFNDISVFCANPFAVICVSLYFMILHVLGDKITKSVMNSILDALL